MRIGSLLVVAASILSMGCFSPQYESGHLRCQAGAHPCPTGFYCIAGGCWRHGTSPPLQLPALWSSSGGGGATSAAGAQLGLSACEAPSVGSVQSAGGATLTLGFLGSTTE
jgi:hypothetical protein